jgi:hypothetical protein
VVKWVLRSGYRVQVPERARRALPDPELDLGAVRAFWGEARAALRGALDGVSRAELGEEAYRHPICGPVDFREGLAIMIDHFDHHLRQIERIRRAPGYPA